ncbi:hypothetical protein HOD38_02875 [archaeon]|jgi:hypothetical protein|nr:hypothetical protein [archaeon]MBT4397185.1 hypothetical protein [archaeon]MBT4440565.1 hypothetical protein [archaeon]
MEDTTVFTCDNCRYRFKRKKGWNETKCPYCGQNNAIHVEDTVNRMLREV